MARKTAKAEPVASPIEGVLVFKANRPMTADEFNLLSDMLKTEQAKTSVPIVLQPYSTTLTGGE